jgi:hypothetical protein
MAADARPQATVDVQPQVTAAGILLPAMEEAAAIPHLAATVEADPPTVEVVDRTVVDPTVAVVGADTDGDITPDCFPAARQQHSTQQWDAQTARPTVFFGEIPRSG